MNIKMKDVTAVYILSLLLALGIGFYVGVELNPKPTQVIVEKTINKKIVEKRVPVEVVVEKHVNPAPNYIHSRGSEVDCYQKSKLSILPPRSKWPAEVKSEFEDAESDRTYRLARRAEKEAMFNVSKHILITKIRCRTELSDEELSFLKELFETEKAEMQKVRAEFF